MILRRGSMAYGRLNFDDLTNVDNSSSPLEQNKISLLSHMIN